MIYLMSNHWGENIRSWFTKLACQCSMTLNIAVWSIDTWVTTCRELHPLCVLTMSQLPLFATVIVNPTLFRLLSHGRHITLHTKDETARPNLVSQALSTSVPCTLESGRCVCGLWRFPVSYWVAGMMVLAVGRVSEHREKSCRQKFSTSICQTGKNLWSQNFGNWVCIICCQLQWLVHGKNLYICALKFFIYGCVGFDVYWVCGLWSMVGCDVYWVCGLWCIVSVWAVKCIGCVGCDVYWVCGLWCVLGVWAVMCSGLMPIVLYWLWYMGICYDCVLWCTYLDILFWFWYRLWGVPHV